MSSSSQVTNVDNAGDGSSFCSVDALYSSVRIRTAEEFGFEHVGNDIIDAEFCDTCCLRPGQYSWKIRLPNDPKIFSGSVYSC
jgi:hypothetical protein